MIHDTPPFGRRLTVVVIALLTLWSAPRMAFAAQGTELLRVLVLVPSNYPHRGAEHPFLHMVVMESLAPLRFTLLEEQPDINNYHAIDGQSLYSQNDANIEPARRLFRQAMLDAVQARQYDVIWLFGASSGFSDEVRKAMRDAHTEGVPILSWNTDMGTLGSLGLSLPDSPPSLPVDGDGQLRPAFKNWSFEDVVTQPGKYHDETIPVGVSVESSGEAGGRIGSAATAVDGEKSLKVFFPGGRNGIFVRIGNFQLPKDINLEHVPITISGYAKGSGAIQLFFRDPNTGRQVGPVGSLPPSPDEWRRFALTTRLPQVAGHRLGLSMRLPSPGTIFLDAMRITSDKTLRDRAADVARIRERLGGKIPRWEYAPHPLMAGDFPYHPRAGIPGLGNMAAGGLIPLVYSSLRGDVAMASLEGHRGRVLAVNPGVAPLLRDGYETQDAWYWYRSLRWLCSRPVPKPRLIHLPEAMPALKITFSPAFATPGEDVMILLEPPAGLKSPETRVAIALRDMRGRLLDELLTDLHNAPSWTIPWRIPDIGPMGTIFRAHVTVFSGETAIAQGTATLNTRRTYDPRERIYYGTWLNRSSSSDLVMRWLKRFYDHAGLNSITSHRLDLLERYGWFGQYEAGNGGIDRHFGFPENRQAFIRRWHDGQGMNYTRASVYNLVSWGEEPGFGPAFGKTWYWKGDPPAGATRWFRVYLRETYGQIDALNRAWQGAYADFSEVPFSKEYMGDTVELRKLEEGTKMLDFNTYRIELDVKKDKRLPFLARYHDTRRFFYWYFEQIVGTLMKDALHRYPWAQHFCSQPNVFNPPTSTPGGYNHPFYAKEKVLRDCLRHRARGYNNPMGRLEWYFVDDPAIQHTLQQSMAVGASYFVAWYAMPLQFNGDLTNTQGGARMNRILAKLRQNAEGPYLQNYYDLSGPVGFMKHGDFTYGISFPEFHHLVPCVLQTGQMPREIIAGRVNDSDLRVLFLAKRMVSDATLTQLRSFVKRGGTLITLPGAGAWDDHGVPIGGYMDPKLASLTGVNPRYGVRQAQKMVWRNGAPVTPDFTPVQGALLRLEIPQTPYERLDVIADDVVVCAAYPDGTPAVTWRRVGHGRVIHLNTECGGNVGSAAWNHGSVPHRYAFTRIFQAIFSEAGLPEPLPRLVNGQTDLGPHQVLWQRTGNITDDVVYIHAYIDPRAGELDARLLLPSGVRVRNLLTGKDIATSRDGSAPLHFDFLQFHLLALRSADPVKMTLAINGSKRRKTIAVALRGKRGAIWKGQRPVRLSFFQPNGREDESLRRWISTTGQKQITHIVALDDVDGHWMVEAFEPISRLRARAKLKVHRQKQPAQELQTGLYGSSPQETVELLRRLTRLYEQASGRPRLSYYLHMRHDSRQSIMRHLERINWLGARGRILNALRKGETFMLTGEDMGMFPGTSYSMPSLYDNHALECIQALMNAADKVQVPEKWPSTLVCQFGKGRLLLDRTSIDETFPPGQEFQLGFPHRASQMGKWVESWRNQLKVPGPAGRLVPRKRLNLRSWLAGETSDERPGAAIPDDPTDSSHRLPGGEITNLSFLHKIRQGGPAGIGRVAQATRCPRLPRAIYRVQSTVKHSFPVSRRSRNLHYGVCTTESARRNTEYGIRNTEYGTLVKSVRTEIPGGSQHNLSPPCSTSSR